MAAVKNNASMGTMELLLDNGAAATVNSKDMVTLSCSNDLKCDGDLRK
jgi:hypothetical protein